MQQGTGAVRDIRGCYDLGRIVADDGVSSDGLATTALPITSAGATLSDIINSGTFHGAIQAITPLGRRFVT